MGAAAAMSTRTTSTTTTRSFKRNPLSEGSLPDEGSRTGFLSKFASSPVHFHSNKKFNREGLPNIERRDLFLRARGGFRRNSAAGRTCCAGERFPSPCSPWQPGASQPQQ